MENRRQIRPKQFISLKTKEILKVESQRRTRIFEREDWRETCSYGRLVETVKDGEQKELLGLMHKHKKLMTVEGELSEEQIDFLLTFMHRSLSKEIIE